MCLRGGALLKISKILVVAGLAAIFAVGAKADGIPDPKVKIVGGGGSQDITYGGTDQAPIIVNDGTGVTDFFYEGPAVPVLYVEVIPAVTDIGGAYFMTENFTCDPGICLRLLRCANNSGRGS